jgi:hypothetical protein
MSWRYRAPTPAQLRGHSHAARRRAAGAPDPRTGDFGADASHHPKRIWGNTSWRSMEPIASAGDWGQGRWSDGATLRGSLWSRLPPHLGSPTEMATSPRCGTTGRANAGCLRHGAFGSSGRTGRSRLRQRVGWQRRRPAWVPSPDPSRSTAHAASHDHGVRPRTLVVNVGLVGRLRPTRPARGHRTRGARRGVHLNALAPAPTARRGRARTTLGGR